jgi:hypothetical protein
MKKNISRTLAASVIISLLVLASCDTPTSGDEGYWLAEVSNPFIGTWQTAATNMSGVTTTTTREFKTDGTIAVTTQQGDSTPTTSTVYYLVKDNFLILSTGSGSYYVKYLFEVIDNNTIKIVQDAGSTTSYTRVGAENPNADRTTSLGSKGITGYFRSSTVSSASTMYDWYTFRDDGTYHVYHWMNNDPHYIDRGDFSYYIDDANRFVSITNGYTVRVWTDFTRDNTSNPKTIGWNDGTARTFNEFDGENFAIE